jgi:hypothetical protein
METQTILDITVTSGGEFLKDRPPLKVKLLTYEKGLPTLCWERSVNDIELTKENTILLIQALTKLL